MQHGIKRRLEAIKRIRSADLLFLIVRSKDPEPGRSVDAGSRPVGQIFLHFLRVRACIQAGIECRAVHSQILRELLEGIDGIGCLAPRRLRLEQFVMHLPELSLVIRAFRGFRALLGMRVEAKRVITHDEFYFACIDVFRLDLSVCLREMAAAEGALVIREFDQRYRRIRASKNSIIIRRCRRGSRRRWSGGRGNRGGLGRGRWIGWRWQGDAEAVHTIGNDVADDQPGKTDGRGKPGIGRGSGGHGKRGKK